jgi:hypothetical protein
MNRAIEEAKLSGYPKATSSYLLRQTRNGRRPALVVLALEEEVRPAQNRRATTQAV